ncbi:hypothetical protein AcV5_007876 [Taiwanofungus camphoratus]|nr:hypothetical protein AcV5_007876 [Antrodia cinnamomea]
MIGKFLKISHIDFMANFLPPPSENVPDFSMAFEGVEELENPQLERDLYQPFVDCVARANMCPGFQFVLTPDRADEGDESMQKVDAGLYADADAPHDGRPHWASQRMWVEWKREKQTHDPFDDNRSEFEAMSQQRQRVRGQIISYAAKVFAHQHRKFLFTIIILRDCARILFWDRSGAAVTEKFNYRQQPEKLGEFLWRFSRLSPEQQGYDPTASMVVEGTEDYELMNRMASNTMESSDYIREYFQNSLDGEWTRWKLSVEEEIPSSETSTSTGTVKRCRHFLVGKPHFLASGVAGRGTRGYVAIDVETKKFVFLKDAWRVDLPGIQKEGDVVRTLNEKEVEHVPTLVCHGDIGSQCTVVQDLWEPANVSAAPGLVSDQASVTTDADSHKWNPLKRHTHYRLVEAEVGRPLSDFRTGRELVKLICDSIKAHRQAVEKANILHRDISAGNILILQYERRDSDGTTWISYKGLLNDWELSKPFNVEEGQRQPDRTGTWQFTSVRLLTQPYEGTQIEDELESFLHVLLYHGIRHLRHNCTNVGAFMHEFFDAALLHDGEYICGRRKWATMRLGEIDRGNELNLLRFQDDSDGKQHPLNTILDELLSWFKAYYNILQSEDKFDFPSFDPSQGQDLCQEKSTKKQATARKAQQPLNMEFDFGFQPEEDGKHFDATNVIEDNAQEAKINLDKDRSKAASLNSHGPMYNRLMTYVMNDNWPECDRTPDQLPKGYSYIKVQDRGMSSKRDSNVLEDVELPQSKRSRSTANSASKLASRSSRHRR